MTEWILIIVLQTFALQGVALSVSTTRFHTQEACEKAAQAIRDQADTSHRSIMNRAIIMCIADPIPS